MDVSIENQVPIVGAKMRIKNLDLEPMLEGLNAAGASKGKLGIDLKLRGKGASVADIIADLNGKISVVMRDGRIATKYLKNEKLLNMDLVDNFLKLFEFTQKKKDFAEINCFVSDFEVTNGIADSRVLVFDTDRVGVLGDGSINLKSESLNLSLRPSKKGGIGVSVVGKVNLGLNIADSFRLGGSLSHPVIPIDKSETAISTALTLGKAIGRTLLFGPAGIAAAMIGGSIGDDNPCIKALKNAAAEEKGKSAQSDQPENQSVEKVEK